MEEKQQFHFIKLKQKVLEEKGLPDIEYPVQTAFIEDALSSDGNFDSKQLLLGLINYSASIKNEWNELETAILRLSQIVIPGSDDTSGNIHTPDFYIKIQPNELNLEIITILRQDKLLAAIRPTDNNKISITTFHALDGNTIQILIELARHPDPIYGVGMRENNWEYALDMAAPKASSMYASERGESYLSYWKYGLGILPDGTIDSDFEKYYSMKPIRPNIVAAQIGTYYEYENL